MKFNKNVLSIFYIILACLINAIGVGLILIPNGVIDGGNSGLSILFNLAFALPVSFFLLLLNLPIYLFALKKIGKNFIYKSIIAVLFYSFFIFILVDVLKLNGAENTTSLITNIPILAAIFGGLLSGIGSGLIIRNGGSLDGVEVLAIYFHKRLNLSVGNLVMIFNLVMFCIAGFFLGFDYPLYSIVAYAIGIKAVDGIVEGLDKSKSIMIITSKGEEVAKAISEAMGRGVTILNGKGFFSKEEKSVIYYVINRFEVWKIKKIIYETDVNAFVSISEIAEILGHSTKS